VKKAIYYIVTYIVILAFSGCNFLEVQVTTHQRSITDVGDGTTDGYNSGETNRDTDTTETIVKTIP